MISNKKGQIITALMQIILAVVVLFAVFKIGKLVAQTVMGGGSAVTSFENLADELNSQDFAEGELKQEIIRLDKGNAVIGFAKNRDHECFECESSIHVSHR